MPPKYPSFGEVRAGAGNLATKKILLLLLLLLLLVLRLILNLRDNIGDNLLGCFFEGNFY